MFKIVCEMCNGDNVVKDNGLYVCQKCGTKYTVEDAKKLMVETEDVAPVTNSGGEIERYQKLAREARSMANSEKAAEYYNHLVTLCPDDWEALFFSVYFTAASGIVAQISSSAGNISRAAKLAMQKAEAALSEEERVAVYEEIAKYVVTIYTVFLSSDTYYNHRSAIHKMLEDTADTFAAHYQNGIAVSLYDLLYENQRSAEIRKKIARLDSKKGKQLEREFLESNIRRDTKDLQSYQTSCNIGGVAALIFLLVGIILKSTEMGYIIFPCCAIGAVFIALITIPFYSKRKKIQASLADFQEALKRLEE